MTDQTDREAVQYWYDAATERREERDHLRAVVARIRQMTDYWEQQLPEVIRTPAVVSAIRAALEPAVSSAGPAPATDRDGLRERIAAAIWERQNPGRRWADCEYRWQADAEADADAVLAVLPATVDRAAVLAEVEQAVRTVTSNCAYGADAGCDFCNGVDAALTRVRRLAGEAQQDPTQDGAAVCSVAGCGHAELAHTVAGCRNCPRGQRAFHLFSLAAVARPGQPETDGEAQGAGETLPPPEGPEYTPCACDHIEPEHEPNAGACWSCDCEAYRATPPAPLRRSEDDCPGFPEQCPNIRPVDPDPPAHFGGIRCGCADEPADTAQQPKEA